MHNTEFMWAHVVVEHQDSWRRLDLEEGRIPLVQFWIPPLEINMVKKGHKSCPRWGEETNVYR